MLGKSCTVSLYIPLYPCHSLHVVDCHPFSSCLFPSHLLPRAKGFSKSSMVFIPLHLPYYSKSSSVWVYWTFCASTPDNFTHVYCTLQVRQKCLPVLRKFNYSWPAPLDCSRLPMPGDDAMCMEVPSINSSSSSSGGGSSNTATTSQHHPDPRPYPDHTRTPSQSLVRVDRWNTHAIAVN